MVAASWCATPVVGPVVVAVDLRLLRKAMARSAVVATKSNLKCVSRAGEIREEHINSDLTM